LAPGEQPAGGVFASSKIRAHPAIVTPGRTRGCEKHRVSQPAWRYQELRAKSMIRKKCEAVFRQDHAQTQDEPARSSIDLKMWWLELT
jgi:hypothetical protein